MSKILVVDDNQDMVDCVTSELVLAGFDVRGASSSSDACDFMDQEQFDVLVSDIQMPELDGMQLSRMLQDANVNTLRIAMSGVLFSDEEVKSAGFHGFIQKPFSTDELLAVINHAREYN